VGEDGKRDGLYVGSGTKKLVVLEVIVRMRLEATG
jgi:hypothetical protein